MFRLQAVNFRAQFGIQVCLLLEPGILTSTEHIHATHPLKTQQQPQQAIHTKRHNPFTTLLCKRVLSCVSKFLISSQIIIVAQRVLSSALLTFGIF